MKYYLFLVLGLLSFGVSAQSSSRTVSETKEMDAYKFVVQYDRSQKKKLREAYDLLCKTPSKLKVVGTIQEEYDNGVIVKLNTRKNKLVVRHEGTNEEGREAAMALAAKVKKHLGLKPPPAPPSPALPGRG
ncbi:MAG: hypothetical protein AAGF89_02150 [Bacteroidota bacterium]